MVFKTEVSHKIPVWFSELKMGDWPFHLVNSTYGNYRYFPRVMGVHRRHPASTWMLQNPRKQLICSSARDVMITHFADRPEYQSELVIAKEAYLAAPLKPTLIRQGITVQGY